MTTEEAQPEPGLAVSEKFLIQALQMKLAACVEENVLLHAALAQTQEQLGTQTQQIDALAKMVSDFEAKINEKEKKDAPEEAASEQEGSKNGRTRPSRVVEASRS